MKTVGVMAMAALLRLSKTPRTVFGVHFVRAITELIEGPTARQDSATTRIAAKV